MGELRFIRKGGRIIPIRLKDGSGSKGGRLKASENKFQKVGKSMLNISGAIALFGYAERTYGVALKNASDNIAKKHSSGMDEVSLMRIKKAMKNKSTSHALDNFNKKISDSLDGLKWRIKSPSVVKSGNKKMLLGLIGVGVGVAIKTYGDKRRSKESRLLNTVNK